MLRGLSSKLVECFSRSVYKKHFLEAIFLVGVVAEVSIALVYLAMITEQPLFFISFTNFAR